MSETKDGEDQSGPAPDNEPHPEGEDRLFNVESSGEINPGLVAAESQVRSQAKAAGCTDVCELRGTAAIAAYTADQAGQRKIPLRTFLWNIGAVGGSALGGLLGGEALWHFLECERWVPTISKLFGSSTRENPRISELELDWERLEPEVIAAQASRNLRALENLAAAAKTGAVQSLINAIRLHLEGRLGDAFAQLAPFEDFGLVKGLRGPLGRKFMQQMARTYSAAGKPEKSVELVELLRKQTEFSQLTAQQRAAFLREELNYLILTVKNPTDYYLPSSPVLRRFDQVLEECLSLTGRTLDEAERFDPVIGPAVICMQQYRLWIHFSRSDVAAAGHALDAQLKAIRKICERDNRLGPNRFSPLVNQHIRAKNWLAAGDVLAEQHKYLKRTDPNLHNSNRIEFGVHLILKAIVAGNLNKDSGGEQLLLKQARQTLAGTDTNRFQADIAFLEHSRRTRLRLGRAAEANAATQQSLWGTDTNYYFFGQS